MANLTETSTFDEGVYQLELTDPVIGGPTGTSNKPLKNLANRTKYLKDQVDAIQQDFAPKESPALTGNPTAPTQVAGNSTTRLANTKFVMDALLALINSAPAGLDTLGEIATELGLKAPLASPALTGNPTGPTAAQFDNDTSLATTEFVQRALGNRAGFKVINAAGSMDASYVGQLTIIQGTTYTRTLPALSGLPDGAALEFMSVGSGEVSIQCAGSDVINRSNTATSTVIKLNSGDTLALVKGNGYWNAVGGSKQLGAAAEFISSLSANGYQRLPSGLIIQWGQGTASSSADTTYNYPIAFPNAFLAASAVSGYGGGGQPQNYAPCVIWSLSKTQIGLRLGAGIGTNNAVSWIAIGY